MSGVELEEENGVEAFRGAEEEEDDVENGEEGEEGEKVEEASVECEDTVEPEYDKANSP
jgi:hypothetical protein